MSTVRLQIVDALATALGAATGLTVHRNLDYALEDSKLPALVVTDGDDAPDDAQSPIGVLDQVAEVELAVLVAASDAPATTADPYEAAIHAALAGATVFAGHSVAVRRARGSWSFDLGDCAARHLMYRVSYRTSFTSLES